MRLMLCDAQAHLASYGYTHIVLDEVRGLWLVGRRPVGLARCGLHASASA